MKDYFEQMAGEEHKDKIVQRHVARLITPDTSDPPLVAERKRREAADRLLRHDAMFGVYPGVTLGEPPPVIERPRFEAGDQDGRDD